MRYLETTCAREVVERIITRPIFYPGVGAKCPLCGNYSPANSGRKQGLRYHRCPDCGFPYSSREI